MSYFKIVISFFLLTSLLFANELNEKDSYSLEEFLKKTDSYREETYKKFIKSAKDFDNYLSNNDEDDYDYDKNFIVIESSIRKQESDEITGDQRVKVRLFLPKVNKKYNVVFESEEEKESDNLIEEKKENINYDIAVNIKKALKNNFSVSSKLGIRLANKLDPFLSTRLRKNWFYDDEIYSLKQKIKYSYMKRLELTTNFTYVNKIDKDYSFLYSNEYYWHSTFPKQDNIFTLFSLRELLSKKNAISYNFSLTYDDNNSSSIELKRYSYFLNFRHKVIEWLHINTLIENFYRKDLDFKSHYAIAFKISFFITKNNK